MQRVAVVAGATGVAGYSLTRFLACQTNWHIVPIARDLSSLHDLEGSITLVEADLNDQQSLKQKLEPFCVTHLFHTAWVNPPGGLRASETQLINPMRTQQQLAFAERWVVPQLKRSQRLHDLFYRGFLRAAGCYDPDERNLQMLANLTDVLCESHHQLEHVALLTGGRFYGMHMGPSIWPDYTIPFTEEMPPHPGLNLYTGMEKHVQTLDCTWSIIRPTFIVGQSPKPSQNIGYGLAIYAWLLKTKGEKLIFPAGWDVYRAKGQYSDAGLLANMLAWTAEATASQNQIFNLVNGDVVSWEQIWLWLGEYFDMEIAVPDDGADLTTLLADREQVWQQMRETHQLPQRSLSSVFSASFLAASFSINWDVEYSMEKAQRHGFEESLSTEQMFISLFVRLEAEQSIPPKPIAPQV